MNNAWMGLEKASLMELSKARFMGKVPLFNFFCNANENK